MRTIAFTNHKGGTGKTTTTVNVGAGLQQLGKKVLLIDLDPQAHLTISLGIPADDLSATAYDLLKGTKKAEEVIYQRGGLDVVPSSLNLSGAQTHLANKRGSEYLLREALSAIKGYNFILIDCPPSLGLLTLNALCASKEVFVPIQVEFLALHGISQLLEVIEVTRCRLNQDLLITGVIATRVDTRKILNREVLRAVKDSFKDKVYKTFIRENICLAEAPSAGKTIFEYKPTCYGAEDYNKLCLEILERE